jgi:two-component system, NarL family, sensor histidine kinase DesK
MKMPQFLPKNREHGWAPYTWLVFLAFFYIDPIANHLSWRSLLVANVEVACFLVLYFGIFWIRTPLKYAAVGCMVAMGFGLSSMNPGSVVFIIFAASFIPWVFCRAKQALIALSVLASLILIHAAMFHPPPGFWLTALVVTLGVGLSNTHFAEKNRADQKLRMAHEEIEHLAKVAERERIARDLHDVLGHTLTLIAVKSTLAGRLIEKDPAKAKSEIADIERVSRDAMAEIRNTLRGYSTYKLSEELQRATSVLKSAGVAVEAESAEVLLTPAQESVAALIMREAVTNVVRHAHARNCRLRLARNNGNCVLEVQDDGSGALNSEGNGLRGMRERVEALGGTFTCKTSAGTSLKFEFPLTASTEGKN